MEKTAAERPAVVEKAQGKAEAKPEDKADGKSADAKPVRMTKSADTKSADAKPAEAKPAEPKTEKIRVILPSPIQPVQSAATPAPVAAPTAPVAVTAPVAPVEAAAVTPPAAAPEERRDANDLARAAIERLRANGDGTPRASETARVHEQPKEALPKEGLACSRVANAPAVTHAPVAAPAPALRPLPPPIMVSGPPASEPLVRLPWVRLRRSRGRLMPRPPTRTGRSRRPIFPRRARWICAPTWPSRPCATAPRRPPKTRCRPRSRSSTRYCRNNSRTSLS